MSRLCHSSDYDLIVYDTAPTGHTLALSHPIILTHFAQSFAYESQD